jgi:hypothetical protein
MKRYPLILVLFSLLVTSCTTELSKENIVGTWNVTDFSSNSNLSPAILQSAKEIAKTGTYHFDDDGSYEYNDDYWDAPETCSWELDLEKKEIILSSGVRPQHFKISSFSKSEMVWVEDMGEMGSSEHTLTRAD